MSTAGKKVFQIAKELLVGHDEIISFLQKNGHKAVKSHMSVLDAEMIDKVLARFSKEKKHADTYKKIKDQKEPKKEAPEPLLFDFTAPIEPEPEIVMPVKEMAKAEGTHASEKTDDAKRDEAPTVKTTEKAPEKKKIDLLENLKSSQKAIDEFKQAFEKARQQLEKQALKDDSDSRGKKKKGKDAEPEPDVVLDDKSKPGASKTSNKKKKKRGKVDDKDVEAAIRETLAKMEDSTTLGEQRQKRKKLLRAEREAEEADSEEDVKVLRVHEYLSAHELADLMGVEISAVIKTCLSLGLMVSINQRLDMDTITLVASEFSFQVEQVTDFEAEDIENLDDDADVPELPRPPIVTIMGHVDHGKTSLLDYIRSASVVAGEAGGITQHIGAYEVELKDKRKITFLDTPGHEAFTAMRARGAQVTDIVVIVVAADDSVMPQTVEAINHAQAAEVPIIIAINKIDKPDANTTRIRTQLADKNILVEDWGGKYQVVELSAKKGTNVEQLLEKILLEAELAELKAKVNCRAKGAVIESQLDKGRGATATVLVESGTLRVGEPFICGINSGRVKAMFDERGNIVKEAGPSTPVQLIGFDGMPQAGDTFVITSNERIAKNIALKRQQLKREQDHRRVHFLTLDEISKQVKEGKVSNLAIVLKGDVDGSVEALSDSIQRLSNSEVKVNIIHRGVGVITESDVLLASASAAIIIGFHVRPNLNARKLAERENIDIRYYNIIYDCIEDIRKALEGMLEPDFETKITGTVEIREVFKISKVGTVAGCHVVDGKINRTQPLRLLRDGEVVFEGKLSSLKRFKDDVREVASGFECGLTIDNFNDIKVGDQIECYEKIELKRTLVEAK